MLDSYHLAALKATMGFLQISHQLVARRFAFAAKLIFISLTVVLQFSCTDGKPIADFDLGTPSPGQSQDSILIEEMVAKIRTEVDAAFIYKYAQTKFVPPSGKTLLIVGQDLRTVNEYMADFSGRPAPGGLMSYWGVTSMNGVDRMNAEDIARQFGRQNHQELVDRHSDTVLQSGLWIVGMWDVLHKTSRGEYDDVIRQFSAWAKATDRPIYLRIGYEFDGEHNQLEPDDYVKAYRLIVDIIRAEGADNVAFVWHSYAAPTYKRYPLPAWYPGDEYVDWVGISLFGHLYSSELSKEAEQVFDFAKAHSKPVMIAEASPINGIDPENNDVWDTWFVNLLSLAYRKNVKAISYINADWPAYPGFASLNWKDARLQNNPQIANAWFEETGKDRYLKQSADLFRELGYSK